ncbi:hypothetical protein BsWGS_24549 [Bradybaena similaris]
MCRSNVGPGPIARDKLQVEFYSGNVSISCDEPKYEVLDTLTLLMHCNLDNEINILALIGEPVSTLCSVYVSGGRNVALREDAQQDSAYGAKINNVTHRFYANLSVDGNTSSSLYRLSCSATTYGNYIWRLTLSQPRLVHSYVLYNRLDSSWVRAIGFKLDSFDNDNNSVFAYKDPSPSYRSVYRITHLPLVVRRVTITYVTSEKILNMCELEVYGDSACDNQHYGFECELSCTCAYRVPCSFITGKCPTGCAVGFRGDTCEIGCIAGKFGEYCNQTCTEKCELPSVPNTTYCNISSGECLLGCKIGLQGDFCQNECSVGMFGKGCNTSCSSTCVPSDDANKTSCQHISGDCLKGCITGYIGPHCEEVCEAGKFGENCMSLCSKNCAPGNTTDEPPCDHITGECYNGCQIGYTGGTCAQECPAGTFGLGCNVSCSQKCAPVEIKGEPPCDPDTGVCYKGCQTGFTGASCFQESVAGQTESMLEPIIVGLCLLLATIVFVAYCFCKRRTPRQSAERKDGSVHPELLN